MLTFGIKRFQKYLYHVIMRGSINKVSYVKVFSDICIIIAVFFLATLFSGRETDNKLDLLVLVILVTSWYFSTKMSNTYDDFRTEKFVGELLLILQNVLIQSIVAGQLFFILDKHSYARRFVAIYVVLLLVILVVKSYVMRKMLLYYRQKGGNSRNIVFIGYNEITENLISLIHQNPHYGFRVLGIIAQEEDDLRGNQTYIGDLEKFLKNNDDYKIDEIVITTDQMDKSLMNKIFALSEMKAIRTKIVPNYINYYQSRFQFQLFGNYPLITLRSEPLQELHWQVVKRIFDVIFTALAFVFLFSWLFPLIAILIRLDSKGPVFFKQDRWGKDNKKFKCYKFRSMRPESKDVSADGKFQQAKQGDPRITKLGAFLRKSSLDELPQFINVLKGEMSIVGPRPHAHEHNLRTKDEVDSYLVRHWIKPGVTGWAQVNGYRGETKTLEQMQKRVDFDIWYIENWSVWLDFKIVFMTVYNVIKGEEMAY